MFRDAEASNTFELWAALTRWGESGIHRRHLGLLVATDLTTGHRTCLKPCFLCTCTKWQTRTVVTAVNLQGTFWLKPIDFQCKHSSAFMKQWIRAPFSPPVWVWRVPTQLFGCHVNAVPAWGELTWNEILSFNAFMMTPVVRSGTGETRGCCLDVLVDVLKKWRPQFQTANKRIHWKAECVEAEFTQIHSRKTGSKIFSSSMNLSVLQFRSSFCFCRRLNTVPSALRSLSFF